MALAVTVAYAADTQTEEEHRMDFIAFDLDQNGLVDASEVRAQFEGRLKQADISAFFIAADKNEDGLISLEEYLSASLRHEAGDLDLNNYKFD